MIEPTAAQIGLFQGFLKEIRKKVPKLLYHSLGTNVAEMEGFEPPRRFSTPTSRFSRPDPSATWVHLQLCIFKPLSLKSDAEKGEK